ncbi:hypothetical protein SAMN05192575_10557 [Nocardioides alpinus]|uniref:Uncharacterized protein n=1 Tax=Nocardioides alpinus TaxID=748909 RepID=A0A1I0Z5I4_9ACTN|nr:hypothetical protein [Nocardioides alpinus]PKH38287.1 hypothetical protein CXG46_16155 [Nocardioides alpinus]SFB20999.1 hypothetical protein SAMN05192575_10557 [Nocardioides alpinus]
MTGSRAHSWVAHLRAGGTTPWLAWSDASPDPRAPGPLPGAQQLELLRRINLASSARPRGDHDRERTRLADRVLAAPAAGRGKADLPLVGLDAPGFGPRPVDPSELSAHELLRVASAVLADDLGALGPDPVRTTWARPWRLRFRLVGDPVVVGTLRADLLARGRPEGGPRPFVVAVGAPLDDLLARTWTQRCFETGTMPWPEWLRFWRGRDQLPPRADLLASVRRWNGRRPFVRIVTDLDLLPRQVGVRRLPEVRVPGADQAELARRVAAVVGLRVPAAERPALMRTLQQRIPASGVAPIGVPSRERDWVAASAERMSRGLSRAGYSVVGDLADLAPRTASAAGGSGGADDRQVLDLAIRMVVDTGWRAGGRRPHEVERQVEQ